MRPAVNADFFRELLVDVQRLKSPKQAGTRTQGVRSRQRIDELVADRDVLKPLPRSDVMSFSISQN